MLQVSPSQRTEGPRGRIAYPVGVVVICSIGRQYQIPRKVSTARFLDFWLDSRGSAVYAGHMKKQPNPAIAAAKAAAKAHRDAMVGKGVPGMTNGQRVWKEQNKRAVESRKACRGKVQW